MYVYVCKGTRNPDHPGPGSEVELDPSDPRSTGAHYCSVLDVEHRCAGRYFQRRAADLQAPADQHTRVKHVYFV